MKNEIPAPWPRLMDLKKAAAYLSVCPATIRDWAHDGILMPVPLPGSCLRDRAGKVLVRPGQRRLAKMLFDRQDLDEFIQKVKEE
jgi:hypothetical protein